MAETSKDTDIKKLEEQILNLSSQLKSLTEEREKLKETETELVKLIKENELMNRDLSSAKSKVDNSYTPQEISGYLGSVIDDFNSKTKGQSGKVDYMINSMDIDLKTQVYKDENEIRLSGVDVNKAGESGVSSIKISIKAIPK